MRLREVTRGALLAGSVLAFGAATLQAQDTTRTRTDTTRRDSSRVTSTQRIPIRKESGGEVTMPPSRTDSIARADSIARMDSITAASQAREDSIQAAESARADSIAAAERARADSATLVSQRDSAAAAARTDSIARTEQARTDSISTAEHQRTDSIARVDSAAGEAQVTQGGQFYEGPHLGPYYVGIAAGAASPINDMYDLGYRAGYDITIPIGWQRPDNTLGVRLILGLSQWQGQTFQPLDGTVGTLTNADPRVYSAALDLTARFPLNEDKTTAFYLLGGGGVHAFTHFGERSALAGYLGNDIYTAGDISSNRSTIYKWGINGGAGFEYGIGAGSIFLESRVVNVFTGRNASAAFENTFGSRGTQVRWVPIILGVTFR